MKQKYLNKIIFIALLGTLSMTPPLSTDMYMASFPAIAQDLNTDSASVSFSLVLFMGFSAIGILFFGPLSDKYGRKKPLLTGLFIYALGCSVCWLVPNINAFLAARVLMGFGGGGMTSLALAIVKDSYGSKQRGSIIALLQSFTIIGPIIAPLLGAIIVQFVAWQYIFALLLFITIIEITLSFLFTESIPKNEIVKDKLSVSFSKIFVIAKDKNFMLLLLVGSFFWAPFFGYLSCCSFIYEDFFGTTETQFAIFFAANAIVSLLGPILSVIMHKHLNFKLSINLFFVFSFISIIAMFTIGPLSAIMFLISFIPYSLPNSIFRPFSVNILLEVHDGDTGSATSLLNFVFTIIGTIGMAVASISIYNYVIDFGICMVIFLAIAFILWIFTMRKIKFNKPSN